MSATPSRTTFDDDRYAAVQARLAALEGTAAGSPLVSNNTVRGAHYEPESTKYGGPLGLDIAEELFDASTSAVLALLPALGDRRPSRLGIALSMTLSALASFGLSWAEMTRFLERYRALWERYRPAAAAPPSDRLRAAAAPFVGHARAILRGERPKGGALARWADAVVNAATRLEAARGQVLPLVTMAGPASTDVDRLLFLLANYVHTHNNRLGLQPSEEAYLAQVATAALEGA